MKSSIQKKIIVLVCFLSGFSVISVCAESVQSHEETTIPISPITKPEQQPVTELAVRDDSHSDEKQQAQPETSAAISHVIHTLDTMSQHTIKLYQNLDTTLEHIAHMITKNITKVANKHDALEKITELRSFTQKCASYKDFEVNPDVLYMLLVINEYLIDYVNTASKKSFSSLPQLNVDQYIKRNSVVDISLETLQQKIEANQKQLQLVTARSTSLGLTWYNKFFRKIADLDRKYNLPTLTGKLGISMLTAGVLYAFNSGLYTQEMQENKTNIFKHEPARDSSRMTRWPFAIGKYLIGSAPTNVTRSLETTPHPGLLELLTKYITEHSLGMRFIEGTALALNARMWRNELSSLSAKCVGLGKKITGHLQGGIDRISVDEEQRLQSTITFDDVVGLEHVKQVLSEIIRYIEDPERYDLLGMAPEKGFLLCGPSRTGKSYVAEALAGEIQRMLTNQGRDKDEFKFFSIDAELIMSKGMSYVLALAENFAPCVLFIDEIDLLGLQRTGGNQQLLSQFLSGLSGFKKNNPHNKVIVIAATNKPESIDEALRKSGRFGKIIHFNYPTKQERKEFMMRKLKGLAVNLEKFDVDFIVNQTEHCTFEDLNKMISAALLKAKQTGSSLTQSILVAAFQEEILNIITKESRDISSAELAILTAQVAGQACAHVLLESGAPLNCATIRPVGKTIVEKTVIDQFKEKDKGANTITTPTIQHGGIFIGQTCDTIQLAQHAERVKQAKVLLAGNVAEKLLLGSCGYSYKPEHRQEALEIIKQSVFGGLKPDELSKDVREKLLKECFVLLQQYESDVEQVLAQHLDKLHTVMDALKKQFTLSGDQFRSLMSKSDGQISVAA